MATLFDVGIFRDTLLPSLALHTAFNGAALAAGYATDRVDLKDIAWPTGLILNAWYSAVGRHLLDGYSLEGAVNTLSRPEWLLLSGVTIWGSRLVARVAWRAIARGEDDPRYKDMKKEPGFWTSTALKMFAMEGAVCAVIALPFTAPFRHKGATLVGYHPLVQAAAVGLFTAGFVLEVLADTQLAQFKAQGNEGLLTEGVWSIVRHPNYLGDSMVHFSYPLLLFSSDLLRPLELLGPITNHLYLRFIGGHKQLEQYQLQSYAVDNVQKRVQLDEQVETKNAIRPSLQEFKNPWFLAIVGSGIAGALVEHAIWTYLGLYD